MIVIVSGCYLLVHEEKNGNRHPTSIQAPLIGLHHRINLLAVTGGRKVERPRKNDQVRLATTGEGVCLFSLPLFISIADELLDETLRNGRDGES